MSFICGSEYHDSIPETTYTCCRRSLVSPPPHHHLHLPGIPLLFIPYLHSNIYLILSRCCLVWSAAAAIEERQSNASSYPILIIYWSSAPLLPCEDVCRSLRAYYCGRVLYRICWNRMRRQKELSSLVGHQCFCFCCC